MSARQHPVGQAVIALLLSLCVLCTEAQEREVLFRAVPRPANLASAVASVVDPAGGQYVYSSERPAPRPATRFAIGKAPQTDYAVFSAEEQHELDLLRDLTVAAQNPANPPTASGPARTSSQPSARVTRRTTHASTCEGGRKAGQVATLAWPKVLQQGDKVCVPKLVFAEKPDWREHLWCFDKGDGRVR